MRGLRCTGGNCMFSMKIRSTWCHQLTCCPLVFNQVTITEVLQPGHSMGHVWNTSLCKPGLGLLSHGFWVLCQVWFMWKTQRYLSDYTVHSPRLSARHQAFSRQVQQLSNSLFFWTWLGKRWRVACLLAVGAETSGRPLALVRVYITTSESGLWLGADASLERRAAFLSWRWTYLQLKGSFDLRMLGGKHQSR